MPIVRIDIQSGKTTEYKRMVLHGVRNALADELGVAHDRIMQRVVETPREDIDATASRSDRLTIVEITMLPRARELKESLYRGIASRLGIEPGIAAHDLVVLVNSPEGECFFLNGRMQCEGATPFEPEPAEKPVAKPEPVADQADEPAGEPTVEPEPQPAEEQAEEQAE